MVEVINRPHDIGLSLDVSKWYTGVLNSPNFVWFSLSTVVRAETAIKALAHISAGTKLAVRFV